MDFGLIPWWTSKLTKDLVLCRKCNNERNIANYWFISSEVYYLHGLLFSEKTEIFFKSSFHLGKKELHANAFKWAKMFTLGKGEVSFNALVLWKLLPCGML